MSATHAPRIKLLLGSILLLCVFRIILKTAVGWNIDSPLLFGDGIHNIGDLIVVLGAVLVAWLMSRAMKGVYGMENLGPIFQVVVGLLLAVPCYITFQDSLLGIIATFPSVDEPLRSAIPFLPSFTPRVIRGDSFVVVAGVIGVAIGISLLASRLQIRAGHEERYRPLETTGKEMRADAKLEMGILAGFFGEYLFHAPLIEYVFGLVITWFVFETALEIGKEGTKGLLQVSIGPKFESEVRNLVLMTPGVGIIEKMETYPAGMGHAVRIKVWLKTGGGAEADADLKEALERRLREHAKKEGYAQGFPTLSFEVMDPNWHRVAYALAPIEGGHIIATGLSNASVLRICDVEHNEVKRATDEPAPKKVSDLVGFCAKKHITIYRAFGESHNVRNALAAQKITYSETPTIIPPH